MKRLAFFIGVCLCSGCGDSTDATGGVGGTSGAGGTGGINLNVWSCTEQGVRDAITFGGGPHTFACDGPTVVTTDAPIIIDNDVILDGEGNLTLDGNDDHRIFIRKARRARRGAPPPANRGFRGGGPGPLPAGRIGRGRAQGAGPGARDHRPNGRGLIRVSARFGAH